MELFHANAQWRTRPEDQRFTSTRALYEATKAYAATAHEMPGVELGSIRAEAINGDVQVVIDKDLPPSKLTHWSFSQLAGFADAPAYYLRQLPADLAVQNINHGLVQRVSNDEALAANFLFHVNSGLLLRAMTGERYSRIWNWEVAERLLDLEDMGWTVAKPDIRVQDDRLPLYASDHDMFAFMMHPDRVIREAGNPLGLKRGVIVSNSEVGKRALRMLRFLYREMCGNHIIWGAEDVFEVSARHIGNVRDKFASWSVDIAKYLDASAQEDEARIAVLQNKRIAATKDELLDALFGVRSLGLSRKTIEAGFDAVQEEDGDPLTVWGFTQGLTRHSATLPHADERTKLDVIAGEVLNTF